MQGFNNTYDRQILMQFQRTTCGQSSHVPPNRVVQRRKISLPCQAIVVMQQRAVCFHLFLQNLQLFSLLLGGCPYHTGPEGDCAVLRSTGQHAVNQPTAGYRVRIRCCPQPETTARNHTVTVLPDLGMLNRQQHINNMPTL